MVEAQIICICPSIQIRDLNLVMKKGQGVFINEAKARASKDLDVARRSGGVQVIYCERFKEERIDDDSTVVPSVPIHLNTLKKPICSSQPLAEKINLDMDILAEKVAERMRSFRDTETNRRLDALTEQVVALIASLAGRPVAEIEHPVHSRGKVSDDDVPVFIPEGLVPASGRTGLKTLEGVSQGSVDEATEALRALRKKKME